MQGSLRAAGAFCLLRAPTPLGRIRRDPAARSPRPGSVNSVAGALAGLAARRDVEVSGFAVSWRRRKGIEALVPDGVATAAARHAGPAAAVVLAAHRAARGRAVHRPPRRRPRLELRRAPHRACGKGGDRPRPDRRPLPGALRPTDARLPRARAARGRRGRVGAYALAVRRGRGGRRARRRRRAGPRCPPRRSAPRGPADGSRPAPPLPEGCRRYVLAVGTVEPRKDYPALVAAFDEIAAGDAEVALVIAGADGWGAERLAASGGGFAGAATHRAVRVPLAEPRSAERCVTPRSSPTPRATRGSGSPRCRRWRPGSPSSRRPRERFPRWSGTRRVVVPPGRRRALASAIVACSPAGGSRPD